mmetsp:Transcript_31465/g.94142  ORF Transcript_31465/g.94142 Transcript_31465/m.94142 type:complete len:106 (+) Transcript_31465:681-998(+)
MEDSPHVFATSHATPWYDVASHPQRSRSLTATSFVGSIRHSRHDHNSCPPFGEGTSQCPADLSHCVGDDHYVQPQGMCGGGTSRPPPFQSWELVFVAMSENAVGG